MALKKTGKGFNILQTYFFPIKVDADEDQKKLLCLAHLKTLSNLYHSAETKFIFCFSQNEVSTEKLSFPFKERYKILKNLPYQLEDKLSLFNHQNMISDIKLTDFADGKRDVLVFSVFRKNIRTLLKDVTSLKITPSVLTCEAAAIANLFETKEGPTVRSTEEIAPKAKREAYLYLKIGHSHTLITAFVNERLHNVYSFEWGVASCIRKISLKYEIPFEKAMQQFCDKAFVLTETKGYTGSQIEFAKLIQQPFEHLLDKLRLLLLQMEGEGDYKCKKIFIYGGGSQIRNLPAFLSTYLNLSVSRVDNPRNFPQWNLRSNDKHQNNLITALGAAMEGLKKPKSPAISFLKEEFAAQFNPFAFTFNHFKPAITLCVSTLILLSIYSVLRDQQTEKIKDKINRIFQKKSIQITKLSPRKVNIETVQKFIQSKQKITKIAQLAEEVKSLPSALDKIKNLSITLKKQDSWNLEIQKLNILGNKVELEGNIFAEHIKSLQKNLQDLAVIGSLKASIKNQLKKKTEETEEITERRDRILFKYSFIQKQG